MLRAPSGEASSRRPLLPKQLKTRDQQLTPEELVVLEEEPQVLHGALGVLAELPDIAAEGLRPLAHQTVEGEEQNAVRKQQGLSRSCDRGGEPKHQDAEQRQSVMPLRTDAHGKIGHFLCVR